MSSAVARHALWILGCFASSACAAKAPQSQSPSKPPLSDARAARAGDCREREAAARGLLASGKLRQAERKLGDCADADARELRTRMRELLGEARRARMAEKARAAPGALTAAELLLESGDCRAALAAAQQRYDDEVPNPHAAVLAGRAAECLGNGADSGIWYARSLFEAELAGASPSWGVAGTPSGIWRSASGDTIVSTRAGAWRLAAGGAREAAQLTPQEPELVAQLADVRVLRSTSELWADDTAKGTQLWRKPLDSGATLVVTSVGPLVVQREDARFRVQIEQLELATGKSSWRAQAPAVQVGMVVSSPEVPWISFETPEPNGRDTSVVLVTEGGRVRRFSADARSRECRPLAVWSQRESLASCEAVDELWAVDVVTSTRRLLGKVPLGSFEHYLALSNGLVSLSGSGGVALLMADGERANLERSSGTADMTWPAVPLWSSDGQRASGVVKQGSREVVSVWDRKTKLVNAVWAGYAEAWPGHRTGLSLSKDRAAITFGDCPAVHRLDLRSGALTTSPQETCGKLSTVVHGELVADGRARAAAVLGSEQAVELSRDGATVLTANGLVNGSRRLLLPHASWKKAEDARGDGLAFADDDRLIVARSGDNVLLWRTADAAYLGRWATLASGDTFFTTLAPSQGSDTGHVEPLQWWGPAQGPSSLRCELAGRNYDWQVCADRFSDDATQ